VWGNYRTAHINLVVKTSKILLRRHGTWGKKSQIKSTYGMNRR